MSKPKNPFLLHFKRDKGKVKNYQIIKRINRDRIHDKFFKTLMSELSISKEFIGTFLKEEFKLVDPDSMTIENASFIGKNAREYLADMLFKFKSKREVDSNNNDESKDVFIYFLFEHKSRLSNNVMVQLLEYMGQIYRLNIGDSNSDMLPDVVPILVHVGEKPFIGRRSFCEFFPKDINSHIWDTRPSFNMRVVDIPREILVYEEHSPELVAFYLAMKLYSKKSKEFEELAVSISKVKNTKISETIEDYVKEILTDEEEEVVLNLIDVKKGGGKMRSIADLHRSLIKQGKKEGRLEGRLEGKLEGKLEGRLEGILEGKEDFAKNMLANNFSIDDVAKITGFSEKKLKEMKSKLFN